MNFSPRLRKSPFYDATIKEGCNSFTIYNRMLMPLWITGPEREYSALVNDCAMWDVGAQRQVQLQGPDAAKLAQLLTPRKMTDMKVGECKYALMCDDQGTVLNDPVLLKLAEDRFWFSIADADMKLWVKGVALANGLDVKVTEPDVSPLAVQGPASLPLLQDIFGSWVSELKYFQFRETSLDGMPIVLARSGWSPELGYELYLCDGSRGNDLWHTVREAGAAYRIVPGAPNHIRRVEGGMLSFGADILPDMNALELGLPPFMVNTDMDADFIGKQALIELKQRRRQGVGPEHRQIVGIELSGDADGLMLDRPWPLFPAFPQGSDQVGVVTSCVFSPQLNKVIALATVQSQSAAVGTRLNVKLPEQWREATVAELPFRGRTDEAAHRYWAQQTQPAPHRAQNLELMLLHAECRQGFAVQCRH